MGEDWQCDSCGFIGTYTAIIAHADATHHPTARSVGGPPSIPVEDMPSVSGNERSVSLSLTTEYTKPSDEKKPMLTRAEYNKARAVLDALPAGYYVKCCECGGWFTGAKTFGATSDGPKCSGGCG